MTVTYPKRRIVVDTREQNPWAFPLERSMRAKLDQGDYSLEGLEYWVSIERKSLSDLVSSLTRGRDRFFRECERLRDCCAHALIVVEGTIQQIAGGDYLSGANPGAILNSLASWSMRHGIHVVFGGDRDHSMAYARCVLVHAEKQFDEPVSEAVLCRQGGNGGLAKNGRRLFQSSRCCKSCDSTSASQTRTDGSQPTARSTKTKTRASTSRRGKS